MVAPLLRWMGPPGNLLSVAAYLLVVAREGIKRRSNCGGEFLWHGCATEHPIMQTFLPRILLGLIAILLAVPSLAQPVSLRCVTTAADPKKVMMVVVDAERGEIKTESFSGDKPHKRMVFHIEEMTNSTVEGRKLGRRKEFFLEFNRMTGHVVESVDDQEPTQYDCEAP